ncbi:DEAD/DEAH box helicase [Paenibacillus wulumuqiensis]|uniref:DEAD/DEAH box helicase n=1 Tax=Paenibacillus wulumuqiensis TaxID=1567107 RepID=UPI0006974DFB|nr:DEAD/DEAH box helicase [Paenibacillus wulumuqiensis]
MAGLFGFMNKRKKESTPSISPKIQIQRELTSNGLKYTISRDNQSLQFPLGLRISELRQLDNAELLELLEELWYEEALNKEGDSYSITYDHFKLLPAEYQTGLEIPSSTKLNLKLAHESAVGSPHFKFVLEKNYESWKNIERTARSIGPWIVLPDQQVLLMDEEQYHFQQMIEQAPNPLDKEQIFNYVAEVRSWAVSHGYAMDDYLQHQEYQFVDQIDIDLNYDQQSISFEPQYRSSDSVEPQLLREMSEQSSRYAVDGQRRKVFVKPSIVEEADHIKSIPAIEGADIARFAENPEAYLPEIEGLDLKLFGERVKSLGIRVYRAQPFVNAAEKDRGWFELDYGFTAQDENGEVKETWQGLEILDLITQAQAAGEQYIEWNGDWLKLPQDAQEFVESTEKVKEHFDNNGLLDVTKLPYVLEIYENINQLEFNQPILQAQQEMQDLEVFQQLPPQSFTASLKPFQVDGFIWMKALHYRKLGGLLADDMGLGKTIQVISFLTYLQEVGKLTPTLIVVPKTLIDNWEKEVSKFAPELLSSLYIHRGSQRQKDPEVLKRVGITITTYHTLTKDQLIFGQVDWQAIICDEAQAIKNPSTASSRVLKAMKAKFRLAMTGTPVENGLSELWSIMDYVQPGMLGSLSQFKEKFVQRIDGEERDYEAEQQLLARISMVYKRRTKSEELGDQLPPKQSIIRNVGLGQEQSQLYSEVIRLVQNKIMDGLQAIQKLKALSSHPALVNDQYINLPYTAVPKLQETVEIIRKVREQGEKVLIFTEYIKMQDILRKTIRECFDLNPMIINGMTNRRQEQVDLFNSQPGFDVLILSPKAAGTGLTITSANHVVHYTRWWNPAVENQATDRAYRIGQDKPVSVYYPIVADIDGLTKNGTVEEIVHRILTDKQEVASSVIVSSRKLNIEDEVLRGLDV